MLIDRDSAEERAHAKDLQLIAEPAREPLVALADEEALAEILDNLVDNAIKYTPAGGTISLRWFVEDRQAIVQTEIAQAFRAAFLTIAAFTAGAGLLALTNPAKRLT